MSGVDSYGVCYPSYTSGHIRQVLTYDSTHSCLLSSVSPQGHLFLAGIMIPAQPLSQTLHMIPLLGDIPLTLMQLVLAVFKEVSAKNDNVASFRFDSTCS